MSGKSSSFYLYRLKFESQVDKLSISIATIGDIYLAIAPKLACCHRHLAIDDTGQKRLMLFRHRKFSLDRELYLIRLR